MASEDHRLEDPEKDGFAIDTPGRTGEVAVAVAGEVCLDAEDSHEWTLQFIV